ncbi:MAG: redoxin family protein [Bdellovibrionota bacterium]
MNQPTQQQLPLNFRFLEERLVPDLDLKSTATDNSTVNLSKIEGTAVLVIQPGSSAPFQTKSGWLDELKKILGAAGCTGELNCYKDKFSRLQDLGVKLFAMSGQSFDQLQAVKEHLELPFELLSDDSLLFLEGLQLRALQYPSYDMQGTNPGPPRVTLVIQDGVIKKALVANWKEEGGITANVDDVVSFAEGLQ